MLCEIVGPVPDFGSRLPQHVRVLQKLEEAVHREPQELQAVVVHLTCRETQVLLQLIRQRIPPHAEDSRCCATKRYGSVERPRFLDEQYAHEHAHDQPVYQEYHDGRAAVPLLVRLGAPGEGEGCRAEQPAESREQPRRVAEHEQVEDGRKSDYAPHCRVDELCHPRFVGCRKRTVDQR